MIDAPSQSPATVRAARVYGSRGVGSKRVIVERVETPRPGPGEVLVRVHAAAITRGELEWAADRLPAIPCDELSGVVAALAPGVHSVSLGDAV